MAGMWKAFGGKGSKNAGEIGIQASHNATMNQGVLPPIGISRFVRKRGAIPDGEAIRSWRENRCKR